MRALCHRILRSKIVRSVVRRLCFAAALTCCWGCAGCWHIHNVDVSCELGDSPYLIVVYPNEYSDSYRANLECSLMREWSGITTDTIRDTLPIGSIIGIVNEIQSTSQPPSAYVDARICIDIVGSNNETKYSLSVGWYATQGEGKLKKRYNDPRTHMWHPFCHVDGIGSLQLDSATTATILHFLPDNYFTGSILEAEQKEVDY